MRTKSLPTLAVIGCGDWGKNIARTAHDLGVLGALCDTHAAPQIMKEYQEQFKTEILPFESILTSKEIDGVLIATPAETHFSLAQKALQAGKHVFVEKPLVKESDQNQELIALAQRQNVTLMVGHLLLHHPAFQLLVKMAHGGDVGEIRFATSRRTNLGKVYPAESVLWDLLPHDVSMMLALMNRMPSRVLATQKSYIYSGVSDIATVELEFPGNLYAEIYLSRLSPVKEQKIVVNGTKGMLTFDDTKEWLRKLVKSSSFIAPASEGAVVHRGEDKAIPLPPAEPLRLEIENFIAAIAGEAPSLSPGENALDVLKVIRAAEASIVANGWVSL